MRTACVKSLSSEFCPGREGPLLFGDPENGAYPEIPYLVSGIDKFLQAMHWLIFSNCRICKRGEVSGGMG